MKIVVVTTLGLVILTDTTSGISKTFLYLNAQALSEDGHCYIRVECLDYCHLTIEFPNNVARDKWLQVFNVAESIPGHAATPSSDSTRVAPQQTQDDQLPTKERAGYNASPQITDNCSSSPESTHEIRHTLALDPDRYRADAARHDGSAMQEYPFNVPVPPSTFPWANSHSMMPSVSDTTLQNPTISDL
ncbi:hypothetical protein BGZ72_009867 [Mortierella alpina]|nr:hypothetical protein BGZ72_009867 [Mortierella alpina]